MSDVAAQSRRPLYKVGRTPIETIEAYSMPVTECGCWIWTGHILSTGYGAVAIRGRKHKAHRAAYEAFRGPIPEGHLVCHKCDVPLCVNPDHLFVGTQADNVADMVAKGRWRQGRKAKPSKPPAPRLGERNEQAVLTNEAVLAIRASSATGAALARHYNVSQTCIYLVRKRLAWGHI